MRSCQLDDSAFAPMHLNQPTPLLWASSRLIARQESNSAGARISGAVAGFCEQLHTVCAENDGSLSYLGARAFANQGGRDCS